MTVYDCSPNDGTTLNSAADSYTAANTFTLNDDFTDVTQIRHVDVIISSNPAILSIRQSGETSYGDDIKLNIGRHEFILDNGLIDGVRIKNASAGNTADYQLTAYEGQATQGATQFRLVRQPDGVADDDVFDVDPARRAFERTSSGGLVLAIDEDGTKQADYPFGQRVELQQSTDDGNTWATWLEGYAIDTNQTDVGGIPAVEIQVVSYDHLLRRNTVYKTYSSQTISFILEDLITEFTAVNWVAGNVTVTNDKTISREFKGVRVDEAIAYLSSESADETWGVNNDIEFFFTEQDSTTAPPVTDDDVIVWDLPKEGARSINRYELFFGPSGNRQRIVLNDREAQEALQTKLGANSRVVISESDTIPEITDEERAETIARQRLNNREVLQTGTVTVPLGRFNDEPGDVLPLTISDAGVDDEDFALAQIDQFWSKGETNLSVVEASAGDLNDLLVGLSDSLGNDRDRDADPTVTATEFMTHQSGVELSVTATLTTKTPPLDAFIVGQSQVGDGTNDTVGGGIDSTASSTVETKRATVALLNLCRDLWQDGNSEFVDLTHIGVGTDGTAATRGDAALESAVDRVAVEKFGASGSSDTAELIATIPAGGVFADAADLAELGVFDADTGGSLYSRLTITDTTIDATARLKIRVQVQVSDDPDRQGVITNTGQERLVDLLIGESNHEPTDMVYGEGTTAAAVSDTSLGNKQHEDTIDSVADRSPGLTDIIERITSGDADTTDFSETGYENAANELLARVVYAPVPDDRVIETNYQFRASNP